MFRLIAGVIRRDRVAAFERILWRLCHGKVYVRTADVPEEQDAPFVSAPPSEGPR